MFWMFAAVMLGFLAAGGAILMSSTANMGPTAAGLACFLGIVGRIAQAGAQHKELTKPKR